MVEQEKSNTIELTEQKEEEEEEKNYNEDEDEDFDPTKLDKNISEDEEETQIGESNYSHIENESDGLIKTRRARQIEEQLYAKRKYASLLNAEISRKINNIWQEMQSEGSKRLSNNYGTNGSVLSNESKSKFNQSFEAEKLLI